MKIKNKKGMTLIEMVVAISIFSLAMLGFTFLFIKAWKSNAYIIEEGESSRAVSLALTKTVSELRKVRQADNGDYPIKSASNFDLIAYIDIDDDTVTEKIHYFLQNGEFKLGISEPSGTPVTYPSGDTIVRTVSNYVTNSLIQPLFYYYNKNYPGDTTNNPLPVPVSNIQDIRLVKINLIVNFYTQHSPDNINFESFAELRNLNDYQ